MLNVQEALFVRMAEILDQLFPEATDDQVTKARKAWDEIDMEALKEKERLLELKEG